MRSARVRLAGKAYMETRQRAKWKEVNEEEQAARFRAEALLAYERDGPSPLKAAAASDGKPKSQAPVDNQVGCEPKWSLFRFAERACGMRTRPRARHIARQRRPAGRPTSLEPRMFSLGAISVH